MPVLEFWPLCGYKRNLLSDAMKYVRVQVLPNYLQTDQSDHIPGLAQRPDTDLTHRPGTEI